MSDNIVTLKQPTKDIRGREKQELTPNARLRWLATLVQTILDAETNTTFTSMAKR